MTDVDDAIFDSIDNDPKLNTNQKVNKKQTILLSYKKEINFVT